MKQISIVSTINALLQDQKFLLALITVLSIVAVQLVPTLTTKADMITNVLIALGGILVLHQGVEDLKGDKALLPADLQTAITQIIAEIFGMLNSQTPPPPPPASQTPAVPPGLNG